MKRLLVLCLALAGCMSDPSQEATVTSARYADPTDRYGHEVIGGGGEWGALEVLFSNGERRRFVLPHERVFEDTEPRLADLDGDGTPEVIVVESHLDLGARLAVYNTDGFVTATGWIGQRHRWLAPVGASDVDGDGRVEIAVVDRPHLNKSLAIYRYSDRSLEEIIEIAPFSNHQIGQDYISGGVRTCKGLPAFVVGNGDLTQVMAVSWSGSRPQVRALGAAKGRESFERALACQKP